MIIAAFLLLQIILFPQFVSLCSSDTKGRDAAGKRNTEKSTLPKSKAESTTPKGKPKSEKSSVKEEENKREKRAEEKKEEKKEEEKQDDEEKGEEKEEKKEDEKKDEAKKEEEKVEEKKEEEKKDEDKKAEKKKEEEKKDEKKKEAKKSDKKKEDVKKDEDKKKKAAKKTEKPGPKLDIAPTELKWEFEQGQQAVKVRNNTKKRFAVKVRCTDNNIYSVAPVTDFVEAGKLLTIAVVRGKGPMKKDKLVVCSMPVSDGEKDAAAVFKEGTSPNVNVITLEKRIIACD